MCTAILLTKIFEKYPLILGFNRDELYSRLFKAPSIYQQYNNKKIIAPLDVSSSGTWIGANDSGLVVAVLNYLKIKRPGKKSRGKLIFNILTHSNNLSDAEEILMQTHFFDYCPCTFILADIHGALIVMFHEKMTIYKLVPGLYVISDNDVFENCTVHVGWVKDYINKFIRSKDIIRHITLALSEHVSSDNPELTTCCHSQYSGTSSSQIISLNNKSEIVHFLHSTLRPCISNYEDYSYLLKQ